jgi:hypothetical protein
MYGYIYKTTNLINNKIYIGKRKGEFNINYKGSGYYLKQAIQKYEACNFKVELIEYCDSLEIQNEREKYWINYYLSLNIPLYNISKGGDGGDTYYNTSFEDRQKRIDKLKENGYFSNISKEDKSKISFKAWETRRKNGTDKPTKEQRQKSSDSHKGFKKSEESILKGIESRKGYKHSEETKRKIRESNKGKIRTEETKKKISECKKGKQTGISNPFYGKTHTIEAKKIIGSYIKERFNNTIWINNNIQNKRIKLEALDIYLKDGYKQGRIRWKQNGNSGS